MPRIVVGIGEHHHLRRPGDAVDARPARTPAAWPRRHRRCPARRCGPPARCSPCHRPAPPPPARRRRGRSPLTPARRAAASTSGLSTPSGRRHAHRDPRHPGHPRRHRVHQHRGRIRRLAARHIQPDRIERRPAHPQRQPRRIGRSADPAASARDETPRSASPPNPAPSCSDVGTSATAASISSARDRAAAPRRQRQPVEPLGVAAQRRIALGAHSRR